MRKELPMKIRVKVGGKEVDLNEEEFSSLCEKNLAEPCQKFLGIKAQVEEEQWPERDALPTGDPIGDVDENSHARDAIRYATANMANWHEEEEEFYKNLKKRCLQPKGKIVKSPEYGIAIDGTQYRKWKTTCCSDPQKYKNVISKNLQFYSCKNCGADLGDC